MIDHIAKKIPGGVTYTPYLSDTIPIFLPTNELTARFNKNIERLMILMIYLYFPVTPTI